MKLGAILAVLCLVMAFVVTACGPTGPSTADNDQGGLPNRFDYGFIELPDGRTIECVFTPIDRGGVLDCNWDYHR